MPSAYRVRSISFFIFILCCEAVGEVTAAEGPVEEGAALVLGGGGAVPGVLGGPSGAPQTLT